MTGDAPLRILVGHKGIGKSALVEVRADEGFVPRPDLRGAQAAQWDD